MSSVDIRKPWRDSIKKKAKDIGYYVIDGYNYYRLAQNEGKDLLLHIPDGHPNRKANEIVAQALSKEITKFIE